MMPRARNTSLAFLMIISVANVSVSAAAIGIPVTAERQWALGGVFSVENADVKSASTVAQGELKSAMFLSEVVYGVMHNAEFFVRAGISGDKLSRGTGDELNFHRKTAWGLGMRGLFLDSYSGWRTYFDAQYFTRVNREVGAVEVDIKEWQFGATIAYKARYFDPYVGFSYGRIDVNTNNPSSFPSSTSKRKFGMQTGVSFSQLGNWRTYAEARFLNGPVVSLGVHRLF